MPSRLTTLAILIFWLATSAWFFMRDVWPYVTAESPPPFAIDLADEALRQVIHERWVLTRNGDRVATITSSLKYFEPDDTFQLTCQLVGESEIASIGENKLIARWYEDRYIVNRAGELLA